MMNYQLNDTGDYLRLSYNLTTQERPTLVFLHDSLGCIELWRDFPQKLGEATGCSVLIYDRQGYGQSSPFTEGGRQKDYLAHEADVLNRLLTDLGVSDAVLFGHSDGGSIALIAAAKYPTLIKAVITEGGHIFVEDITLTGLKAAVKLYQTTSLKEKLQKYHSEKTEAVFRTWTETWLDEQFRDWTITSFLPHIQCPVLVIQGEKDEYGSMAQVEGIVQHVSGKVEVFIVLDAGHSPHKENAEATLEKATAFIETWVS